MDTLYARWVRAPSNVPERAPMFNVVVESVYVCVGSKNKIN
jgi:hypothetical protein